MLDHQGRKDAFYDENVQVYAELARLAPIIDATQVVAPAALLHSDEIGWAWNHAVSTRLQGLLATCDVSTQGRLLEWYRPLYEAKVTADILHPLRDLSGYPVVLAPNLYLIHPALVENLRDYVQGGGLLIVGPKAGLKNGDNVFFTEIPPCGGLADLLGVTVQSSPLRWGRGALPAKRVTLEADAPFSPGVSFANPGLFDNLDPAQAEVIARHEDGHAAITLNRYGEGLAMYVGCQPEAAFYARLIEWLIDQGRLEPAFKTDADVEVTKRVGGGHTLIFVLNHNPEPVEIALEQEVHELISDQVVSGALLIGAQDVKIFAM